MQAVRTRLTQLLGDHSAQFHDRFSSRSDDTFTGIRVPIVCAPMAFGTNARTAVSGYVRYGGHTTNSRCHIQVEVTRCGGFGFVGAGAHPLSSSFLILTLMSVCRLQNPSVCKTGLHTHPEQLPTLGARQATSCRVRLHRLAARQEPRRRQAANRRRH